MSTQMVDSVKWFLVLAFEASHGAYCSIFGWQYGIYGEPIQKNDNCIIALILCAFSINKFELASSSNGQQFVLHNNILWCRPPTIQSEVYRCNSQMLCCFQFLIQGSADWNWAGFRIAITSWQLCMTGVQTLQEANATLFGLEILENNCFIPSTLIWLNESWCPERHVSSAEGSASKLYCTCLL